MCHTRPSQVRCGIIGRKCCPAILPKNTLPTGPRYTIYQEWGHRGTFPGYCDRGQHILAYRECLFMYMHILSIADFHFIFTFSPLHPLNLHTQCHSICLLSIPHLSLITIHMHMYLSCLLLQSFSFCYYSVTC